MIFRAGRFTFSCEDKTLIMGVINVTPDSFSDGGHFFNTEDAVHHAEFLVRSGADIIDIGGESTRPGARPVSVNDECARVIPVIECLSKKFNIPISIDTTKSEVARRALCAGASIVNDVSALREDSRIGKVVAEFNAGLVLMHRRGNARTMQEHTYYEDIINEVIEELSESLDVALGEGVSFENIALDPGIGFSKTAEQNLFVLKNLARFKELGRPVCVGTSRKSLIGNVLEKPVDERIFGTAATVALSVARGANIVRVHDVSQMRDVAKMSEAICCATKG